MSRQAKKKEAVPVTARQAAMLFLGVAVAILWLLAGTGARAQPPGIIDVVMDRRVCQPGDVLEVLVWGRGGSEGRYVMAVELRGPSDEVVYDSHQKARVRRPYGDDVVLKLAEDEVKLFGPFQIRIPEGSPEGTYHIISGLRRYPWEPVVQFRGGDWCLPEDVVEVHEDLSQPTPASSLPEWVRAEHGATGKRSAYVVLSVYPSAGVIFRQLRVQVSGQHAIAHIFSPDTDSIGELLQAEGLAINQQPVQFFGLRERGAEALRQAFSRCPQPVRSFTIHGPLPASGTRLLLWLEATRPTDDTWPIEIEVSWVPSASQQLHTLRHTVLLDQL